MDSVNLHDGDSGPVVTMTPSAARTQSFSFATTSHSSIFDASYHHGFRPSTALTPINANDNSHSRVFIHESPLWHASFPPGSPSSASVSSCDPLLLHQSSSAFLSSDWCSSPTPSAFSPYPVTFSPMHSVCRSPSVCSDSSSTVPLIPSDGHYHGRRTNPSVLIPSAVVEPLSTESSLASSSSLTPSTRAADSQATLTHTLSLSTSPSTPRTPSSVSRKLFRRFSSSSRLLATSLRPSTSSGLARQKSHVAGSQGEGEGYESDAGGGRRSVRSSPDWWRSVSSPSVDLRRRLHSLSPLTSHRQVQQQLAVTRLSQAQAQQCGADIKRRKQHLFVMCRADCGDVAGHHWPRKQKPLREDAQLSEWGRFQAYQVGVRLRKQGWHVSHVIAAPERSCLETAAEVVTALRSQPDNDYAPYGEGYGDGGSSSMPSSGSGIGVNGGKGRSGGVRHRGAMCKTASVQQHIIRSMQRPDPPTVRQWVEQTRQQEAAAARERMERVKQRVVHLAGGGRSRGGAEGGGGLGGIRGAMNMREVGEGHAGGGLGRRMEAHRSEQEEQRGREEEESGAEEKSLQGRELRGGEAVWDEGATESNSSEGRMRVGGKPPASCVACVTASVSASLSPGSEPAKRTGSAIESESATSAVASPVTSALAVDVTTLLHAAMEELSDQLWHQHIVIVGSQEAVRAAILRCKKKASVFQVMPAGYAHLERIVTFDTSTLTHCGMGPWRLITSSGSCGVFFT